MLSCIAPISGGDRSRPRVTLGVCAPPRRSSGGLAHSPRRAKQLPQRNDVHHHRERHEEGRHEHQREVRQHLAARYELEELRRARTDGHAQADGNHEVEQTEHVEDDGAARTPRLIEPAGDPERGRSDRDVPQPRRERPQGGDLSA